MKLENIVYLELNLEPIIEILQDYGDTMKLQCTGKYMNY